MRFHIFGLPHTKTNQDYTSCAYTAKVLKFGRMMTQAGHTVIHYGHPDSALECTEHVDVISRETYDKVYGTHDFHSKFFTFDTRDEAYQESYRNTIAAIYARKQARDFLLPFWGAGHRPICDAHPDLITVEPGIGYASGHWARFKVFESYAIFHAYKGLTAVGRCDMDNYETVIPNYFDARDFDYNPEPGSYVLYLGRVYDGKGVNIAIQATERSGHQLIIAGQNAQEYFAGRDVPAHVQIFGHADREQRRHLYANAVCTFVASQYLEPFGGVMVESLLSGTPIITTDWGAATEINVHGTTGYRCRTMSQYVWAVKNIHAIQRSACRDWAVNNYTLEAVRPKYEEYFSSVLDIYGGAGWYAERDYTRIQVPHRT